MAGIFQLISRFAFGIIVVALVVAMAYVTLWLLNRGLQVAAAYFGYEIRNFMDWSGWRRKKSFAWKTDDQAYTDQLEMLASMWHTLDERQKEQVIRHMYEYMDTMPKD